MNRNNLNRSFLISSFLLQYPNAEWKETLLEVLEEAEKLKDEPYAKELLKFLEYAQKNNVLDLAELYVSTFDFTKKNNLYLTYYEYKEDRKRGEALLELKRKYREAGVNLLEGELPDFLPVMLEFCAASGKIDTILKFRDIIEKIFENLSKENNPYLNVLKTVLLVLQGTSLEDEEELEVLGGVNT
jgi:nitrate reductase delta subunit